MSYIPVGMHKDSHRARVRAVVPRSSKNDNMSEVALEA